MYSFFKRILDIVLAIILLMILAPLFGLIAVLIRKKVFYYHLRVGKNNKFFKVIKFRTMIFDDRPIEEIFTPSQLKEFKIFHKVKNDPRITKIGRFLRKTSLDEIPQLINILKGEMSFVGPRPITLEKLNKIKEKNKYLSVIPGLTGYWAINGRSKITYKKRIELELYYVENQSFWLDFKIFIKTIFIFFRNSE